MLLVPAMEAEDTSAKPATSSNSMTLWQARQKIVKPSNYALVAVGGTVGKVDQFGAAGPD